MQFLPIPIFSAKYNWCSRHCSRTLAGAHPALPMQSLYLYTLERYPYIYIHSGNPLKQRLHADHNLLRISKNWSLLSPTRYKVFERAVKRFFHPLHPFPKLLFFPLQSFITAAQLGPVDLLNHLSVFLACFCAVDLSFFLLLYLLQDIYLNIVFIWSHFSTPYKFAIVLSRIYMSIFPLRLLYVCFVQGL